jgi:hypothetical protein
MRARVVDVVVPTFGVVRLRIFHECPTFHTGRAIGPAVMGSWWAERGLDRWVYLWEIDTPRAQSWLEVAIDNAIGPAAADAARAAQDARAEAPDV